MIEITANANAEVTTVDGSFPLGQKNQLKINIEDELIKEYIKILGTGVCNKEYNLYSYGTFDTQNSINNIVMDLNPSNTVNIQDGIGRNFSRCLCCSTTGENELGKVSLTPNMGNLQNSTNYTFSVWLKVSEGSANIVAKTETDTEIFSISADSTTTDWVFYTKNFIANSDTFILYIEMPTDSTCYIDNISLFETINEINITADYLIGAEIEILNPCQPEYIKINKIINWTYDKETDKVSLILYFPSITYVDFQLNLLCKLKIYQKFIKKIDNTINSIEYYDDKNIIYNSEPFVLEGYIIPPTV